MPIVVKEGFIVLRIALVVGSLSPVFLIWAVRGSQMVAQQWLWMVAILGIFVPALTVLFRVRQVMRSSTGGNLEEVTVKRLTDRREHLLSYLFPLLLSFWAIDFDTIRDLIAFLLIIALTGIAFWHLQLIYVNFWFAILGYRSVQIDRPAIATQSLRPIILLTRSDRLCENDRVTAYRLTNSLYLHKNAS